MTIESPLIFHHKKVSPYSEKIRLMLGHTNLQWRSVQAPLTPPRPSIDPLVGGYRRIPVAQIDADIFCDTRIIATEIADLSNNALLNPFNQTEEQWLWSEYIETEIFQIGLNSLDFLGLIRALFTQIPLGQLPRYLMDEKHLVTHANPKVKAALPSRPKSKQLWLVYLDRLENQLQQDYFAGSKPGYLDFCTVHLIWFRMAMERRLLKGRPTLETWYHKMLSLSHGNAVEISPTQAIDAAKAAAPRPIPTSMTQSRRIGRLVSVTTTDIFLGSTQGKLVGENDERWILARDTKEAGLVHIHFPKATYQLTQH